MDFGGCSKFEVRMELEPLYRVQRSVTYYFDVVRHMVMNIRAGYVRTVIGCPA